MNTWDNIKIDHSKWKQLVLETEDHKGYNPFCSMTEGEERLISTMYTKLKETSRLPYGYIGEGFPNITDQRENYRVTVDRHRLRLAFLNNNYVDVMNAIYQANHIMKRNAFYKGEKLNVLEFGCGYGRMAIPFLFKYRNRINYVGVDYLPLSLLLASEFLPYATNSNILPWYYINDTVAKLEDYDYVSLPAWDINKINEKKFDLFIVSNSFSRMSKEAIDYLFSFIKSHASKNSLFYYYGNEDIPFESEGYMRLMFKENFPINRDGYKTHAIWRFQ